MMTALSCALICALLLAIDLISKTVVAAYDIHQIDYFLNLVRIDFHKNNGMMLGIGDKSAEWVMILVTALTGVMIVGIVVLFFTLFKKNRPAQVALAVIEAGAVGNFIDRVCLDYVRDFLNVKQVWFFPSYTANFADVCIMAGAVVLIFIILFIGKGSVFPITKKWRDQAKAEDARKAQMKQEKKRDKQ